MGLERMIGRILNIKYKSDKDLNCETAVTEPYCSWHTIKTKHIREVKNLKIKIRITFETKCAVIVTYLLAVENKNQLSVAITTFYGCKISLNFSDLCINENKARRGSWA